MVKAVDVVVIGGGPAGLSAALVLGRARRHTLLLDAGAGRNAPAAEAHGVFTRDGTPPAELRQIGRDQLAPYGVEVRAVEAVEARRVDGGFEVVLTGGEVVSTRKLLLATGLTDDLPPIEGFAERWGRSVVDCPFCHGWEVRDEPVAVLARGEIAVEYTPLIRNWSRDLVLCTDGDAQLDVEQRRRLEWLEIPIREERIARLEGQDGALERIVFADGGALPRRAIFVRTALRQRSDLPERLGCALTDAGRILVDERGRTSVPGVAAAGDAASRSTSVINAAAGGALAAASLTHELAAEDADRLVATAATDQANG